MKKSAAKRRDTAGKGTSGKRSTNASARRSSTRRAPVQEETELDRAMRMVVERLEEGEVISYADVAERAGYPGRHRAAGRLLRHSGDCLPWWRVVYSDGGFPPVDPVRQERNLIAENVEIKDMRVISSPKGRFA